MELKLYREDFDLQGLTLTAPALPLWEEYDVMEQLAALCSCFGGGFKAKEICGVISGAAVVLGARWPHKKPEDKAAKELASEKMKQFNRAFLARFPGLTCRDLKDLPPAVEKSPASQRLGVDATCRIYVIAAVEILEEMLAAE